jgi:hypothetical protein
MKRGYLLSRSQGPSRASRVRGLQRTSCWRVGDAETSSRWQSVAAWLGATSHDDAWVLAPCVFFHVGDPPQPIDQGCCFGLTSSERCPTDRLRRARGVQKLGRMPDPLYLQEDRIRGTPRACWTNT